MPSIYDDPRVSGGDRIRFEQVGDAVKGRITKAEVYIGQSANGYRYELADVSARQSGRQEAKPYAEVIATQTQLVPQLKDQAPVEGDVMTVELVNLQKTGANFTLKVFTVQVQKANASAAPAPAPASWAAPLPTQAPAAASDDPFA